MPRIRWKALPRRIQEHLADRMRLREISTADLTALLAWISSDVDLPDGPWCKDFGTFKLVGEGAVPKTFLNREQACVGQRVE